MQLISLRLEANVHRTCDELTRLGYAHLLLSVDVVSEEVTVVVLRASDEMAPKVRARLNFADPANRPYYADDIDHRWPGTSGYRLADPFTVYNPPGKT